MHRLDQAVVKRRPISSGDVLFRAGERAEHLIVVRTGSVKTVHRERDGQAQILGFHLPGELFGIDGMAHGSYQSDAIALEQTSVCDLPLAQLPRLIADVPSLQSQLMRLAGQEIGLGHEHLLLASRKQAQARLAGFLLSLQQRYNALGRGGDRVMLSMSRTDIANYLSLAIETVSRLFARFQTLGVIAVRRREVCILDGARLEHLTGCDTAEEPVRIRARA